MDCAVPGDGRRMTLAEYESLPAGNGYREELVRGLLVREPQPASEHGWLVTRLASMLHAHAAAYDLGIVLAGSGFILSEDPPTVRGPDISFVRKERASGLPSPRLSDVAPDLAIEILSPSNRAAEMQEKVADYLAAGVRLIWIVDPAARAVAVHRPQTAAGLLRIDAVLRGADVLPGFSVPLDRLFARR